MICSTGETDSGVKDLTLFFITGNCDELELNTYYLMPVHYVPVCVNGEWRYQEPQKVRLRFRCNEFAKGYFKFDDRIEEWVLGTKDGHLYTALIQGVNGSTYKLWYDEMNKVNEVTDGS